MKKVDFSESVILCDTCDELLKETKAHKCNKERRMISDDHAKKHRHTLGFVCVGCDKQYAVTFDQYKKELDENNPAALSMKSCAFRCALAETL